MILNGCYVSVELFRTVCNDVYSRMFIFGSIMTKNERKMNIFKKLSDMIINASEWFENISEGRSPI